VNVVLRAARTEDCEQIYAWNCAPDVRAVSRDARAIHFDDHRRWFARRLKQAAPLWIIEANGEPAGTVRIDRDEHERASISIALGAGARGRGIGRRAIQLACARWDGPVHAEILDANLASRGCFEACGFVKLEHHAHLVTYVWTPEAP
jgi:RimJ/RimL family protein N-acetyltransferase